MSTPPPHFFLYSTIDKEPNVGIWLRLQEQSEQGLVAGQPVRLQADLVEWDATPGGPDRTAVSLRPRPYKYTTELEGEIIATTDVGADRKWWFTFIPPPDDQIYAIISVDPEHKYVWTAREPGAPIRIEPFNDGDRSQVFKLVPLLKE